MWRGRRRRCGWLQRGGCDGHSSTQIRRRWGGAVPAAAPCPTRRPRPPTSCRHRPPPRVHAGGPTASGCPMPPSFAHVARTHTHLEHVVDAASFGHPFLGHVCECRGLATRPPPRDHRRLLCHCAQLEDREVGAADWERAQEGVGTLGSLMHALNFSLQLLNLVLVDFVTLILMEIKFCIRFFIGKL